MGILDDFADSLMSFNDPDSPWAAGRVDGVVTGAAEDGNPLVTVKWKGRSGIPVSYAASYTPVVGHMVLMARHKVQLAIVCRLIGTPPAS